MAEEGSALVKDVMDKAEVSLILDTYDDIFSDFDPRPYNERALSEDFLSEAKKAMRDKDAGIQLSFLIPKAMRDAAKEELIKMRLRSHFRRHYKLIKDGAARRRRQAIALILIGAAIGLIDALLLSTNNIGVLFGDAVEIVLTPASWYTIWTGFDHLLIKPADEAADGEFYRKMVDVKITFVPY